MKEILISHLDQLTNKNLTILTDGNFFNLDQIKSMNSTKRKIRLLNLIGTKDFGDGLLLNELIMYESYSILARRGQICNVESSENKLIKAIPHNCHGNSLRAINYGYKYVEGIAIHKGTGFRLAHAWNSTIGGSFVDFTYPDAEEYLYFGVTISNKAIHKFFRRGNYYASHPILPFL